jgi:hypothetical protein
MWTEKQGKFGPFLDSFNLLKDYAHKKGEHAIVSAIQIMLFFSNKVGQTN